MASIETRTRNGRTTYRVIWWEPGRKRVQYSFGDAKEAAKFKADVDFYRGWPPGWSPAGPSHEVTDAALTFGAWALRTIANRSRASERTKADYRRDLDRHFARLLARPLDAIGDDDVTAWTAQCIDAGLSDKTVRNLHGFASSIYVDALAQQPPLCRRNPFAKRLADRAHVRTEEMTFLTPQEFSFVLGYVRAEYRDLFRLLFATGLRFGEATALTVGDVQLLGARRTLTVTKAWKRTGTATWQIGEPKTKGSRRTISLSPELQRMLATLTAGRRGTELLFPGADGGRLPHVEVYKRGWAPAVARARVCDHHYEPQRDGRGNRPTTPAPCDCAGVLEKTPRLHDLRHSHASALIAAGVPLAAISRRLGHSSITITIDRYGHLDPSLDAQIDAATDRTLTPELVE